MGEGAQYCHHFVRIGKHDKTVSQPAELSDALRPSRRWQKLRQISLRRAKVPIRAFGRTLVVLDVNTGFVPTSIVDEGFKECPNQRHCKVLACSISSCFYKPCVLPFGLIILKVFRPPNTYSGNAVSHAVMEFNRAMGRGAGAWKSVRSFD